MATRQSLLSLLEVERYIPYMERRDINYIIDCLNHRAPISFTEHRLQKLEERYQSDERSSARRTAEAMRNHVISESSE